MTPGLEVDHGAGVLLGKLDHVLLYELSHPVARSVTLQNMVSQPQLKMDMGYHAYPIDLGPIPTLQNLIVILASWGMNLPTPFLSGALAVIQPDFIMWQTLDIVGQLPDHLLYLKYQSCDTHSLCSRLPTAIATATGNSTLMTLLRNL